MRANVPKADYYVYLTIVTASSIYQVWEDIIGNNLKAKGNQILSN